jgi:hypothetical protein
MQGRGARGQAVALGAIEPLLSDFQHRRTEHHHRQQHQVGDQNVDAQPLRQLRAPEVKQQRGGAADQCRHQQRQTNHPARIVVAKGQHNGHGVRQRAPRNEDDGQALKRADHPERFRPVDPHDHRNQRQIDRLCAGAAGDSRQDIAHQIAPKQMLEAGAPSPRWCGSV